MIRSISIEKNEGSPVSVDWFFKLKEIDSLSKMKNQYLSLKKEQEDRIAKLRDRQESGHAAIAKLKHDTITTNTEMADIEKKLKQASEQRQRLLDMGGDSTKIKTYETEISTLEEKGFELMTRQEEIETEISDIKGFQAGLEKTIIEIEQEAFAEIQKMNQDIANFDLRLNLLQEELPPEFNSLLTKTMNKKLAHGPFTRVDQGSCYFCRFKISKMDEIEIDLQKNLKVCNQCGRIFLPYGS
jgi:predicted  nucleic acid-binding Zn-ribbon protein